MKVKLTPQLTQRGDLWVNGIGKYEDINTSSASQWGENGGFVRKRTKIMKKISFDAMFSCDLKYQNINLF